MTTQRRGRRWHRHGLRHISEVLPEVFRRIGPDRHQLIDDPPPEQHELFDDGPEDDFEEDGDSEHDE
jgi:hypothetical protein